MKTSFQEYREQQRKIHRNNTSTSTSTTPSNNNMRIKNALKHSRKNGALRLANCNLSEIPLSICNPLDNLDDDEKFWEISPLTKVDLSHNNIITLPNEFVNLKDNLNILILQNNQITYINDDILEAFGEIHNGHLQVLDLSSNRLEGKISESFIYLNELRKLNLSSNQLIELSNNIGELKNDGTYYLENLEELYLQRNFIQSLPNGIVNLRMLQQINLSYNQLEILPNNFGSYFPHLHFLDLSNNNLRILESFPLLTSLTYLDLKNNSLIDLPVIPNSPLKQLFLDNNNISVIENNIIDILPLTLTHFHIENNQIKELPEEIGYFPNLKALDISNNDLRDLPYSLGYIDSLNSILTEGNAIKSIRRTLLVGEISKLKKYLQTRGDPLIPLSQSYINRRNNAAGIKSSSISVESILNENKNNENKNNENELKSDSKYDRYNQINDNNDNYLSKEEEEIESILRQASINGTLDLSSQSFEEIIPSFWISPSLSSIQRIDFSNIHFHGLPDDFSTLVPSLNTLILDNLLTSRDIAQSSGFIFSANTHSNISDSEDFKSLIHSIFTPILYCNNLKVLSFQRNRLYDEIFAYLSLSSTRYPLYNSIEEINFSHNNLRHVPDFLSNCRNLETFSISYNNITSCDGCVLDHLRKLRHIDLSNNQIVSIGEIWRCSKLTTLNIENNQLNIIPPELSFCKHLNKLLIYGNPQHSISHDIIGRGTKGILKMLSHRTDGIKPHEHRESFHEDDEYAHEKENELYQESDPNIWTSNQNESIESELLRDLNNKMNEIQDELDGNFSLSQAKTYALKKNLAKLRAAKIKEERRIKLNNRK